MSRRFRVRKIARVMICAAFGAFFILLPAPRVAAQHHHETGAPPDSMPQQHEMAPNSDHSMQHGEHPMPHAEHAMSHAHHAGMEFQAMYGPYSMTREASGTSWQPDRALHRGLHAMKGSWMLMLHGFADLVADDQGGPRGDSKTFAGNMVMGMAERSAGPGRLGIRTMLSLEPATIGRKGYPLLLQTGETSDGAAPLIDRQHPHDLFMELAATYSVSSGRRSLFVYGGLPGEPALGPPAFMHRFSGAAFPQAPISHHWLDSSHITFGVLTGGIVLGNVKLEASGFRGREPDSDRWDIEEPKLDSHSFRVSANPAPGWSLQASRGRLKSPEELEPTVDVDRTTASAIYASNGERSHREVMLAWGRNRARPGETLDAFAVESAAQFHERHTIFGRAEHVEKNELFPESSGLHDAVFDVVQGSLGYRYDFVLRSHAAIGAGAVGTLSSVPEAIRGDYGDTPRSWLLFLHAEIR